MREAALNDLQELDDLRKTRASSSSQTTKKKAKKKQSQQPQLAIEDVPAPIDHDSFAPPPRFLTDIGILVVIERTADLLQGDSVPGATGGHTVVDRRLIDLCRVVLEVPTLRCSRLKGAGAEAKNQLYFQRILIDHMRNDVLRGPKEQVRVTSCCFVLLRVASCCFVFARSCSCCFVLLRV